MAYRLNSLLGAVVEPPIAEVHGWLAGRTPDRPLIDMAQAVPRHAPPAVSGRRIRLRYATQVSTRPPTFVAFCSRPAELPRSYVRYLTNSLREVFGMPGVPIRFSLKKSENPYAGRAGRGKARRS